MGECGIGEGSLARAVSDWLSNAGRFSGTRGVPHVCRRERANGQGGALQGRPVEGAVLQEKARRGAFEAMQRGEDSSSLMVAGSPVFAYGGWETSRCRGGGNS